ncbi:MAG: AAA family ATPase [Candidatus Aegiribacteria sp.]|nr:AAA family ATPase [Candidatus Aegiribacteria sp.]MBD3293977.1 AAA family ATPase [Candidatus Fermentibacteria bacterium]
MVIIIYMNKSVRIPPVFLAGPPCSGKSSTGYLLAKELSFDFCDLDKRIEKLNKTEILHIFRKYGESRFRQIESRALLSYLKTAEENFVMALGGGCLLQERNLSAVRERGIIITLHAPTELLLDRLENQRVARPLAPSSESMKALLNKRREHYMALPNRFDTSKTSPDETASKIADFLKNRKTT